MQFPPPNFSEMISQNLIYAVMDYMGWEFTETDA